MQRLRELAERKETILKAIEAQGKLNPDLAAAIRAADNPKRLEDLYLPFKPKKRTKASDARDAGLEPLAFRIWTRDETLTDLAAAAAGIRQRREGRRLGREGARRGRPHPRRGDQRDGHWSATPSARSSGRPARSSPPRREIPEGQGLEYRDYFDYSEPVAQIPPHRVLAINRGDKEGPLKVRLEVSRPDLEAVLFSQLPLEGHPQADLFRAAAIDALDRLILPSMEREVRRDLTEAAEKHAVEVFARNLRSLLLQPPIPKQVVLAIDPGFRTGCKVAVLDPGGNLLDQAVIYPAPAPEPPVRGQGGPQGPGGQAPGGRGRDRQRHGLPRDRGTGRRDHRRRHAVQPGRRRHPPPEARERRSAAGRARRARAEAAADPRWPRASRPMAVLHAPASRPASPSPSPRRRRTPAPASHAPVEAGESDQPTSRDPEPAAEHAEACSAGVRDTRRARTAGERIRR